MTKKATEKENIINSCYAVKMELTECITDCDIFLKIYITIFRGVADDNEKIRKMENNF